jgi:hypothetical protein
MQIALRNTSSREVTQFGMLAHTHLFCEVKANNVKKLTLNKTQTL